MKVQEQKLIRKRTGLEKINPKFLRMEGCWELHRPQESHSPPLWRGVPCMPLIGMHHVLSDPSQAKGSVLLPHAHFYMPTFRTSGIAIILEHATLCSLYQTSKFSESQLCALTCALSIQELRDLTCTTQPADALILIKQLEAFHAHRITKEDFRSSSYPVG